MFTDLVTKIAEGTDLRPSLRRLAAAWRRLPASRRRRFATMEGFAHAAWSAEEKVAFPWQRHPDVLAPTAYPFTAHILYRSAGSPALHTWELVGFTPLLRQRLGTNLASIESLPEPERPTDLRVAHREIITAFRIEDMALHRQVGHLTDFLVEAGARILHVRGVNDGESAERRRPFQSYAVEDYRARLRMIIAQLFAMTPTVLAHPSTDPAEVLRDTGADAFITYDPQRTPRFELEPVLKAECGLYLCGRVLELDGGDLSRTIAAVSDVLDERFFGKSAGCERVSA